MPTRKKGIALRTSKGDKVSTWVIMLTGRAGAPFVHTPRISRNLSEFDLSKNRTYILFLSTPVL